MHQESFDGGLGLLDLLEVARLLFLVTLHVIVDFFLLFVEDFVLLHVLAAVLLLVLQVIVDVLDVPLVSFDHPAHVSNLFLLLFDFCVVLLDAVHEPLASFWEWKIHLVCLEF